MKYHLELVNFNKVWALPDIEFFVKISTMDSLVEKLKEFGLNSTEAKVYLALLKKYPATGYEVSQIADIPQPRAYDGLKSLEAEGIVISSGDKPQKYSPIAPKELTKRFRRRLSSSIDFLEKKLPDVKEDYTEPIQSIGGYETILEKLREVISNSKESLYLEIWSTDYSRIEDVIMEAYDRGVSIKIVGYDNLNSVFGLVYKHDDAKDIEYLTKSRMVSLLADNQEAVFGRIEKQVVWTKNNDIAYFLKEYMVHDMYMLDVYQRFPEQLRYFYGTGFKKLKDKILDKKSSYNL